MSAPLIDEIAHEFDDIKVGKINVDEQPELAIKFQATAIPTLVVVNGGEAMGRMVGVKSKDDVLKLLEK
jgi:thioredoxin 1